VQWFSGYSQSEVAPRLWTSGVFLLISLDHKSGLTDHGQWFASQLAAARESPLKTVKKTLPARDALVWSQTVFKEVQRRAGL
jgi:hypothetical protein